MFADPPAQIHPTWSRISYWEDPSYSTKSTHREMSHSTRVVSAGHLTRLILSDQEYSRRKRNLLSGKLPNQAHPTFPSITLASFVENQIYRRRYVFTRKSQREFSGRETTDSGVHRVIGQVFSDLSDGVKRMPFLTLDSKWALTYSLQIYRDPRVWWEY